MTVRLIATDLDGTLLLPDATIAPGVRSAIARAQRAGIDVVLMTARSWRSARHIAEAAGVTGLAVCSNGAVIYDLSREEVVHANTFDSDALASFVRDCQRANEVVLAWETATAAYRSPEYHAMSTYDAKYAGAYLRSVQVVDSFDASDSVTKLLIRHPTCGPDELLEALRQLDHPVTLTISGGPFVEVTAPGITKAHALQMLCADRGLTADDVVAIGDQVNDLPMLLWAGRGVAMGNAHPDVLAAVAERTASNVEDGAALVIESVLGAMRI
ncbi:MAG: hypothetical protein QOJ00_1077 [Actinomycetota bacterium]